MRKWLWIGVIALSCAGIGQLIAAGTSSLVRVKSTPASLYVDGKKIAPSDHEGYFRDGTKYVPATLEYEGIVYVPLQMVGQQLDKQVGWDEKTRTVWLGKQPQLPQVPPPQQVPVPNAIASSGKPAPLPAQAVQDDSLFGIRLGMSEQQVLAELGQPSRKEPSALGYQWWIYNRDLTRYVQVGVLDGKVVDIYSNAPLAKLGGVGIGTSMQSLARKHELKNVVTFTQQGAHIQITNQTKERPLVISGGTPFIFYIDKHNQNKVTAVRAMNKLMLLRGGFYETKWTYQGQAPDFDPPALSIKQREQVNAAYERQILDLVNVVRHRYKLPLLTWNEPAAKVARGHSQDMEEHDFFDHVSATTGLDPFERLKQAGVHYQMAGENIAAGYPDAIEAYESWMNSPGHRKNILEKGFTQLGVGVSADYYTQAFVTMK
jgi:uncharacterized protein YkwD